MRLKIFLRVHVCSYIITHLHILYNILRNWYHLKLTICIFRSISANVWHISFRFNCVLQAPGKTPKICTNFFFFNLSCCLLVNPKQRTHDYKLFSLHKMNYIYELNEAIDSNIITYPLVYLPPDL